MLECLCALLVLKSWEMIELDMKLRSGEEIETFLALKGVNGRQVE